MLSSSKTRRAFIEAIESGDLTRVNNYIKVPENGINPSFAEEGNEHLQQMFEEIVTDKDKSIEDKLKAIAKIDPKLRRLFIEELKYYNSSRAERNSLFEQRRLIAGLTLFAAFALTMISVATIVIILMAMPSLAFLAPLPEMLLITICSLITTAACMPGFNRCVKMSKKMDEIDRNSPYNPYNMEREYYPPGLLQELNNMEHIENQKVGGKPGTEIEMRDLRDVGNEAPNLNVALIAASPSSNAALSHPAARHLSSSSIALEQDSPLINIPSGIDISNQKQQDEKEVLAPGQARG